MEILMKESLKITNLMEKVFKNLNMKMYMLVLLKMALKMDKESLNI
jgi:hypothetical protein